MDVGAFAVSVEDHDEFRRFVDGCQGVWGHGGELGRLAGLDRDLAFAERKADPSLDDEEPVVAGVDPLFGRYGGRFEAQLDGEGFAGRSTQHPGCALAQTVRYWADDDVLVAAQVEE
jgi:hypothetical protein